MLKLTKFIYATIGLWAASTLLIYTGFSTGTTSSTIRLARSRARSVLPMVISSRLTT